MNKKHTLYVLIYSLEGLGGAEKNFVSLAKELVNRGHDTMLILGGSVHKRYNVKSFNLRLFKTNPNLSTLVPLTGFIINLGFYLVRNKNKKIVLVSFGPVYSLIGALLKLILRFQFIVCERNSIKRKKESKLTKVSRWLYLRQADLTTTNSKKNHELLTAYGYRNISIVRNYYDEKTFNSKLKNQSILRLVIVSRLEPQKRILETIKKIKNLDSKLKIKLDIYGDGHQQNEVRDLLFNYSKTEHTNVQFKWHGFIPTEDIPFHQFDLSLHFSSNEGASNSMIEALTNGIPVLCSKHHVNEVDFLITGENCYVCELNDLEHKFGDIEAWLSKVSSQVIREVTLTKLNLHPPLHELILDRI